MNPKELLSPKASAARMLLLPTERQVMVMEWIMAIPPGGDRGIFRAYACMINFITEVPGERWDLVFQEEKDENHR